MKKGLLFAAAALISMSASAEDWYLVGANGSWNFDSTTKLVEVETGVYEKTFDVLSTNGFQVSTANYGTQYSSHVQGMEFGKEYSLTNGGYQQEMSMAKEGKKVTVTYNATNKTFKAVAEEQSTVEMCYYIKGSVFGDSWANHLMTNNEGKWEFTSSAVMSGELGLFSAKVGTATQIDWIAGNGAQTLAAGSSVPVKVGGQNIKQTETGEFTYVFDPEAMTLSLVAKGGEVSYPETFYVIGNVNGKGWGPDNGIALTNEGEGVYTGKNIHIGTEMGGAYGYFSFTEETAASWDTMGRRYGALAADTDVVLGNALGLTYGENSYKVAEGDYDFTVNLADMTVTLTASEVEVPVTLSATLPDTNKVAGTVNWVEETEEDDAHLVIAIKTSEEKVAVTFAIPEGYDAMYYMNYSAMQGRKAAGADWMTESDALQGGLTKGNVIEFASTATPELQLYGVLFGADGKVDPTMYRVDATVEYDQTVAVEGIEVEAAEAVYFNLQGVKVANPENGVFVKVVNGKASKVVL